MTAVTSAKDRILLFLRHLESPSDIVAWSASFKLALGKLLPDVDRISVNVNRGASVTGRGLAHHIVSTMRTYGGVKSAGPVVLTSCHRRDAEYFVESFHRSGFPVEDYQRPICLNYEGPSGAYFGSIILWQRIGSPKPSDASLIILNQLTLFITYSFASAIERYHLTHRQYAYALRAANELIEDTKLTRRERHVFLCRFEGLTVSETAARLSISEATVRRHIRAIGIRLRDLESPLPDTLGLPFVRLQHALETSVWSLLDDAE